MLAFEKYDPDRCCLCGEKGQLTGEHKFKATQIRSSFPDSELLSMNNPDWKRPKFIQGSKSSNLKFKKSVCTFCNSSRTQSADRAFDEFHNANSADLERVLKDREQLGDLVRPVASEKERDVFRYFAKLLCCFLAEIDGPRPKAVGAFAASLGEHNPILLSVSEDPALAEIKQREIGTGWVAHGGLWLTFDKSKRFVEKIGSRLTVGHVRYEYWVQLNKVPQLELLLLHRAFLERAKLGIIE